MAEIIAVFVAIDKCFFMQMEIFYKNLELNQQHRTFAQKYDKDYT
jgi:hypothetical protein